MTVFSVRGALDAIDEQRTIRKTCQRIVDFPFRDVGLRPRHPMRFTHAIPQREASRQHPSVRSVLAQNPVLTFEMRALTFDVQSDLSLDSRTVLRMQAAEPFSRVLPNLVLFVSQHGRPSR